MGCKIMRLTLKRILSIFLVFVLLLALSACGNTIKSETGIKSFEVEDLSEELFYAGVDHGSYKLNVKSSKEYDENSIRVVIEDESLINVTHYYKDGLMFTGIKFNINCLKAGTTSFYFETIDSIVKSDPIEITVNDNLTAITLKETEDIIFDYSWYNEEKVYFDYESVHYVSEIEDTFLFVSENPDIATFEYDSENSWLSDCGIVTPIKPGETYVYIQTNDGSIKSEKIKVVVVEDETESESEDEEVAQDNSRTVYTTPTGEKYHYSQSCAGKNAKPTTENAVKGIYDPCKKCAR